MTCAVFHNCTRSRPWILPSTRPRTMTSRATTSAFTVPFGPTVRLLLASVSLPSIGPSIKRSSLPVTSPLMRIPWLMQAAARAETGGAEASRLLEAEVPAEVSGGAPGLEKFSGVPCGFTSSFFHIWDTSTKDLLFEVAFRRLCWAPRLGMAKIVQGLASVKRNGRRQIWGVTSLATLSVVARVGAFLLRLVR